jgi:hypothetical protein
MVESRFSSTSVLNAYYWIGLERQGNLGTGQLYYWCAAWGAGQSRRAAVTTRSDPATILTHHPQARWRAGG